MTVASRALDKARKERESEKEIMEGTFYVARLRNEPSRARYCHAKSNRVYCARKTDEKQMSEYHTHDFLFQEASTLIKQPKGRAQEVVILGAIPRVGYQIKAKVTNNAAGTGLHSENGKCLNIFHLSESDLVQLKNRRNAVVRVTARIRSHRTEEGFINEYEAKLCSECTRIEHVPMKRITAGARH
jgi:hypothetical protein